MVVTGIIIDNRYYDWYSIDIMENPLAFRMRPLRLGAVIGQEHIVGPDGFLTNCLKQQSLVSVVLYGPPGTGKTTIAEAFAKSLDLHFSKLNAVTASKKEIETAMDDARLFHPSIMLIDEVHRLPKDKQDLLLASIEDGTVYLVGATTANPYMSLNPALRSRCHLLEVQPLTPEHVTIGLRRALDDPKIKRMNIAIEDDVIEAIARLSGGDLRYGYNVLEILFIAAKHSPITLTDLTETIKVSPSVVDKDEGGHYDAVSALQKSIRGSDVDAALYYLARLIAAGDLESIQRRLLVTAYEDVGLANPGAVSRAVQALESAKLVGFPEAIIPLGFAVCDLALSPKSKAACEAINRALDAVKDHPQDVLDYLKLTPVGMAEEDKYPYDRPDLWEKMQYLPDALTDMRFFVGGNRGAYLRQLNDNYKKLTAVKRRRDLANLKREK